MVRLHDIIKRHIIFEFIADRKTINDINPIGQFSVQSKTMTVPVEKGATSMHRRKDIHTPE